VVLEKVVELEDCTVHLKPLTVRAIITLINSIPALFSEPDEADNEVEPILEVVIAHRGVITEILRPFVSRSDGKEIETLGEHVELLHDAFMEVNPLFLTIVSEMIHPAHLHDTIQTTNEATGQSQED